jgi:DNA-binding response OmpR family regulator
MRNARILIVDDEENFLQLLFQTLGKEGYQVRIANNGNDGIKWLETEPFDLALIDIKMAPMNGLTLLEKIKTEYSRMKVIMITAFSTPENQNQCIESGADAFLIKPIEIRDLKEAIQNVLS